MNVLNAYNGFVEIGDKVKVYTVNAITDDDIIDCEVKQIYEETKYIYVLDDFFTHLTTRYSIIKKEKENKKIEDLLILLDKYSLTLGKHYSIDYDNSVIYFELSKFIDIVKDLKQQNDINNIMIEKNPIDFKSVLINVERNFMHININDCYFIANFNENDMEILINKFLFG